MPAPAGPGQRRRAGRRGRPGDGRLLPLPAGGHRRAGIRGGANTADANACYYLGCLFYDRFRYGEAVSRWEEALRRDPGHAKALRCLSLAYFDKCGDAASARACMERALDLLPDPRLLFEYQQLLKNSNVPPEERLAVYDRYPRLLEQRDDCYLDRIVLLCMKGRYEEAIGLARAKHFHIYEGGEGNLTKQHAWMHLLYGNELAAAAGTPRRSGPTGTAPRCRAATARPRPFSTREAHLYFYLGLLLEKRGDGAGAKAAFEEASVYKAAVSELSLFRALALRRLLRFSEAQQVLQEMLDAGDSLIENKDLRGYYGVGSPCPMPFEYDIEKQNLVNGHILRGYALLGLGRGQEADAEIAATAALDPYNFRLYAYGQIRPTL